MPTDRKGVPLRQCELNEDPPTPPRSMILQSSQLENGKLRPKEIRDKPTLLMSKIRQGNSANREQSCSPSLKSTPRKRVISDEHWMKTAGTPKIGASGFGTKKSSPKPHQAPKVAGSTEIPHSVPAEVECRTPKKRDFTPPGAFPDEETSEGVCEGTEIHQDESISVRAAPKPSAKQKEPKEVVLGISRKSTPLERKSMRPDRSLSVEKKTVVRAPALKKSPARIQSKTSHRSSGRSFGVSMLRDVFDGGKASSSAKAAAPVEPPSRLEAWLATTPDPFLIESESNAQVSEVNATAGYTDSHPKPRKISGGPRKVSESPVLPRREASSPTVLSRTVNGAGQSSPNREPTGDRNRDDQTDSSPGLRRAGAKRRQSHRPNHGVVVERESAPIRQFLSTKLKPELPTPPRRVSRHPSGRSIRPDDDGVHQSRDSKEPVVRHRSSKRGDRRDKLASNADLMSVLSMPLNDNRKIKAARSVRAIGRLQPDPPASDRCAQTNAAVLSEFRDDEVPYARELRTLVDGVIPVLLNDALSDIHTSNYMKQLELKAEPGSTISFTQPVIELGVALEKLKTLHAQLLTNDARTYINWAELAIPAYDQYIAAWRLDYQDVTVTLAAFPHSQQPDDQLPGAHTHQSDILQPSREKVDVAYLLKRPLIRLKYIAKTVKALHATDQFNRFASIADHFERLSLSMRTRVVNEKARLEDEAAATIDVSRARNLRTLDLQPGTVVACQYRVKARDCFDLELRHGSGQRVDCKVEMIIRDSPNVEMPAGDILICEVDELGRWLLFPPIQMCCASTRAGDKPNELVVMIRPNQETGVSWYELLTLRSDEEGVVDEWLQMLGQMPVPPSINRATSMLSRTQADLSECCIPVLPTAHEGLLALTDSGAPLGATSTNDPPVITSTSHSKTPRVSKIIDVSNAGAPDAPRLQSGERVAKSISPVKPVWAEQPPLSSPRSSKLSRYFEALVALAYKQSPPEIKTETLPDAEPMRSLLGEADRCSSSTSASISLEGPPTTRQALPPPYLPSTPPPLFAKVPLSPSPTQNHRAVVHPHQPPAFPVNDVPPPARSPRPRRTPITRPISPLLRGTTSNRGSKPLRASEQLHIPSPCHSASNSNDAPPPPPPPPHRISTSRSQSPRVSVAKPAHVLPPPPPVSHDRRTSSPLKHEYAPSSITSSASSTVSYGDDLSTDDEGDHSSSETSEDDIEADEDEELEDGDAPTPLLPIGAMKKIAQRNPPQGSMYSSSKAPSVRPDDSASQGGEPDIPSTFFKTYGSIWCWSDKGAWERLHKDECTIVVSAGLIEAFEKTVLHSGAAAAAAHPGSPVDKRKKVSISHSHGIERPLAPEDASLPLIGLELTPLVPLRRGTAVDISVRSPPTPRSRISSSNNIMFRARNPEECERLYAALNHARIYNPTYIALQNARPKHQPIPVLHRDNSTKRGGMWSWTSRQNSYRAKNGVPASLSSRSSIGSLTSAFSALKRLSGGSRGTFDISKSTVHTGSRPGSVFTSSSGSSSFNRYGGNVTPPTQPHDVDGKDDGSPLAAARSAGEMLGLNSAKIHLYRRETASKWRDLGSAKLSVLHAEPSQNPFTGVLEPLRRVYITSKKRKQRHEVNADSLLHKGGRDGEGVLLDVSLPEQCFERVARTGIALSVWEERKGADGVVGKTGGVAGGKISVYMIQMKAEAETAYTYGLVGKMRY